MIEPASERKDRRSSPESFSREVMDSTKSNLVFVNKDASSHSLTRSQGSEKAFILSHVQRQRRSKKGPSNQDGQPWSQFTSRLVVRQAKVPGKKLSKANNSQPRETLLLVEFPSNNGSDPFHCTIAAIDAGNHAMLRFTFAEAARLTFLAEAFAPAELVSDHTPMRHENVVNERLKHCIEDKALMYSTLAYGSSCMGWMAGVVEDGRPPEYFIAQALEAVRLRLTEPVHLQVDNWLLLSIYSLAITELWNKLPSLWTRCPMRYTEMQNKPAFEAPASRTHLTALMTLVQNAGGWDQFDPYILESAILADKYLSLWELKPPVISLTWDPGPIPRDLYDGWDTSDAFLPFLGTGFAQNAVSNELYLILTDVVDFVRSAQSYWSTKRRHPSFSTETHIFLRHQALIHRLLSIQTLDGTNDCIRLAAITFLLNATSYHGSQVCARTLITRLRSALVASRFWDVEFDAEVRIWCLFTGAMTTEVSPDRDWFLCMIDRFLEHDSFESMEKGICGRMGKYLMLPQKQEPQIMRLAKVLASRNL